MKPIIPFALLGALLTVGAVKAAQTTPVGYTTQALFQGFNTVGLTLHPSAVASGNFETISGTALTDTSTTFAPVAGRLYVLEITSGTLAGTIQEVPAASISGSTINTPQNLQTGGLQTTDTYNLRLAPTLEEVFTTTSVAAGGTLLSGLNSTNADVVWVPNGLGGYDQYFLHSGSNAFRIAGTTTPSPNVPLVYADGILVQKKTTVTANLTVTGEVKKVGTNSVLLQGFNLVGTVAPAGLTLRTAGLEDDIFAALNTTNADIVWIQQANLSYKKYFRHTSGGGVWRDFDAPTVNLDPLVDPPLNGVIYIQRKPAGAAALDLLVPASYSSL